MNLVKLKAQRRMIKAQEESVKPSLYHLQPMKKVNLNQALIKQ